MAHLNTFAARSERSFPAASRAADRHPLANGPAKRGEVRGKGPRKAGAGGTEFLLASAVLGVARGLHRRGLIGTRGFRVALTLAEHLSARGIAKWRAARRFAATKDVEGP